MAVDTGVLASRFLAIGNVRHEIQEWVTVQRHDGVFEANAGVGQATSGGIARDWSN